MTTSFDAAIVLAAGAGRRMAPAGGTSGTPKPLLAVDAHGTTFLDWHVLALGRAGIREIFVVGSEAILGTPLRDVHGVRVTWIDAAAGDRRTGSAFSLHAALVSPPGVLDGRSRVLVMDADLVYDPDLVREFASAEGAASKTLVCSSHRETGEEVVVFARAANGRPCLHGKGLVGSGLTRGLVELGEATGMLAIEPGDHDAFRAAAEWTLLRSRAGALSEHEDVTQLLLATGAMDAVVFDDATRFSECDTPEDLAHVRNHVAPRWRPRLGLV
ncbi:MAG: NTP transferase domain-containing protein [Polyangiaceae bacterium]